MIGITGSEFAANAAHFATRVTAPNAAQLQGTGVPTATAIDASGTKWRLRGNGTPAEHDSVLQARPV